MTKNKSTKLVTTGLVIKFMIGVGISKSLIQKKKKEKEKEIIKMSDFPSFTSAEGENVIQISFKRKLYAQFSLYIQPWTSYNCFKHISTGK